MSKIKESNDFWWKFADVIAILFIVSIFTYFVKPEPTVEEPVEETVVNIKGE